jgi:hypothetical protein
LRPAEAGAGAMPDLLFVYFTAMDFDKLLIFYGM